MKLKISERMFKMKKYDLSEVFGTHKPIEIYRKLKEISESTGNDGKIFEELIIKSSIHTETALAYSEPDDDEITYAMAYSEAVEALYPDYFGLDSVSIWEGQKLDGGEYTIEEFFNLCYMYITSYLTTEKEFLEELDERIGKRNDILMEKLETDRKAIMEMTASYLKQDENRKSRNL